MPRESRKPGFEESRREKFSKMKKVFVIVYLFVTTMLYGQTTQVEWKNQVSQAQSQIRTVLADYCPSDISIDSFKIALIKGTMIMPDGAGKRLEPIVKSLNAMDKK